MIDLMNFGIYQVIIGYYLNFANMNLSFIVEKILYDLLLFLIL